jgi:Leucine-rich repeat (LRR) protein
MILLRDNKGLDPESSFRIFAQLPYLRTLSLAGVDLEYIPDDIRKLDSLFFLVISGNSRIDFKKTFLSLKKLNKLTVLDLSENHLHDLPSSMSKLRQIKSLVLSKNNFEKLPTVITKLIQLQVLDFYKNKLKRLPKEITNLQNLERLYLQNDVFSEEEIQKIHEWLPNTEIILGF